MWNPVKDYPISPFLDGINKLVGSLLLFFVAGVLGLVLTSYEAVFDGGIVQGFLLLPMAWLLSMAMGAISLVGIPFLVVHFWILFQLLYSDYSRLNLFFIAFFTQACICISIALAVSFSETWVRSLISIGLMVAVYVTLRLRGHLRWEPVDQSVL